MVNKTEYIARSLSKGTHKKFETFVINSIYSKLNNPEIEIVTQQHVSTDEGMKYIDLYFPQLKIAVEVDEGYHDNLEQKDRDNKREEAIKKTIQNNTIVNTKDHPIKILRVPITINNRVIDLEDLNKEIDCIVKTINESIAQLSNQIIWHFDSRERLEAYKERGFLSFGDYFDKMVDIVNLFSDKNFTGNQWQRCTYPFNPIGCFNHPKYVWSPELSINGSNKDGWINTISDDLTTIYERATLESGNQKTEYEFNQLRKHGIKRITFLNYKDPVLGNIRKFIGVYEASEFDKDKKSVIWRLCDTMAKLEILK